MDNPIDIGNVRGLKGDKGEKGDRGRTPSYDDIKYLKQNDSYIILEGEKPITQYYCDAEGRLCNKDGYLLNENLQPTNNKGTPFDKNEYGYEYEPIWLDKNGRLTNEKGELIDKEGKVLYAQTSFLTDLLGELYNDDEAYTTLVTDIYPHITDTLTTVPPDPKYKPFFDAIEGDVKYYICADNPKTTIYLDSETNKIINTCRYYDAEGNLVKDSNGNPAYVPLEKNALYLYNESEFDDNEIMHYDVYVCTKAGTVPKKIISHADFKLSYNVIDDLQLKSTPSNSDDDDEVKLWIITRGSRGQFYSIPEVDKLFDNNLIQRLGSKEGIAQLDKTGIVPDYQLPFTKQEFRDLQQKATDLENNKVDKINGKGLSTNDYTNAEKKKLGNIEEYANKTIIDDHLDANSNNPVANSVITSQVYTKDAINTMLQDLEGGRGHLLSVYLDESTGDLVLQADEYEYYTTDEVDEKFTVNVEKQSTPDTGFLTTYVIKQGGKALSPKINIPKDFLVKSASLETVTTKDKPQTGFKVGEKYFDFVINSKDNTSTDEHLYLNVNTLVDIYEADENSLTLKNNKFSIKEKGIQSTHLSDTLKEVIDNKVDKEINKGLSTNDYTNADKSKLDGISYGANKITKTSELTNDNGFITEDDIVLTDNNYTDEDKQKLYNVYNRFNIYGLKYFGEVYDEAHDDLIGDTDEEKLSNHFMNEPITEFWSNLKDYFIVSYHDIWYVIHGVFRNDTLDRVTVTKLSDTNNTSSNINDEIFEDGIALLSMDLV